jgi:hypothetical protein
MNIILSNLVYILGLIAIMLATLEMETTLDAYIQTAMNALLTKRTGI